jgi:hypothetical protein
LKPGARAVENDFLTPRHEFDRLGQRAHRPGRNDDRAVNVGVNDDVVPGEHAENVHVAIRA